MSCSCERTTNIKSSIYSALLIIAVALYTASLDEKAEEVGAGDKIKVSKISDTAQQEGVKVEQALEINR